MFWVFMVRELQCRAKQLITKLVGVGVAKKKNVMKHVMQKINGGSSYVTFTFTNNWGNS